MRSCYLYVSSLLIKDFFYIIILLFCHLNVASSCIRRVYTGVYGDRNLQVKDCKWTEIRFSKSLFKRQTKTNQNVYFLKGNRKENISLLLFWPCDSDSHQISTSRTVNGNDCRSHFIWKCGLQSALACFTTSCHGELFTSLFHWSCFFWASFSHFSSVMLYWHDEIQTSALPKHVLRCK